MSALTTTLKAIRAKSPCTEGWQTLLEHLGKTGADETPLPVMTVLDSNGMEDALWVIDNCIDPYICRLFAADCADRVLHLFEDVYPNDDRPRRAIEAARDPNISYAAWDAAWTAARNAAKAAERDAVRAVWVARAAWDAALGDAWGAARSAALGAGAAAWDAVWDAQRNRLKQYIEHGEAAKDMPWAE